MLGHRAIVERNPKRRPPVGRIRIEVGRRRFVRGRERPHRTGRVGVVVVARDHVPAIDRERVKSAGRGIRPRPAGHERRGRGVAQVKVIGHRIAGIRVGRGGPFQGQAGGRNVRFAVGRAEIDRRRGRTVGRRTGERGRLHQPVAEVVVHVVHDRAVGILHARQPVHVVVAVLDHLRAAWHGDGQRRCDQHGSHTPGSLPGS